jgi:hypothetical protein
MSAKRLHILMVGFTTQEAVLKNRECGHGGNTGRHGKLQSHIIKHGSCELLKIFNCRIEIRHTREEWENVYNQWMSYLSLFI